MRYLLVLSLLTVVLSGCATQKSKPHELGKTIESLRKEIASAQAHCRDFPDDCKSGLLLSGGEITLVLTELESGEVGVSIPVGVSTFTAGATTSKGSTSSITLKFDSPLFASDTALAPQCVTYKDDKRKEKEIPVECDLKLVK